MRRANRMLVVAMVVATVGVSGAANASLFRHRKAEGKPAADTAAVAGATLNAIDVDGSRITLRTSATPVYTSYNAAPDVFVVDLTATSKGSAFAIPSTLPAGVSSVAAEEAVEMGTRLTRVTFRFAQPLAPQAAATDNNVIVTLPAVAAAADAAPVPVAALPPVEVKAEPKAEPKPEADAPRVEPIPDAAPAAPAPAEPVAVPIATASGIKAKKIQRVETSGSGANVQVTISGDGSLTYKAFTLENPSRLVLDFTGVKNAVAKSNLAVSDSIVKRVRVGQFATVPTPVARVVLDLASKSQYHVAEDGDAVRVTFGEAPAVVAEAPKVVETPKVAEVKAPPADVPSQVPTVAPEASTWKMPAEPKPAKHAPAKAVINATADQAPPNMPSRVKTTTSTNENVFTDSAPAPQPSASSILPEGTRILANPTGNSRTLSGTNQKVYTGEPLSLNLKEADIRDVLRTFGDLTGLNIAVDPDVGGKVTVNFNEVPWDQALDIILHQNSLNYVLEGNVLRIGKVDRLASEQQAQRRLEEEQRLNVNTITAVFKLSYARASEVQNLIREIASPRARIIVDARTNQLIVSEIPTYLSTINDLINTLDIPTRQVMIEARIVEASKVFQQQYGFSWGFSGAFDPALGNGTGLVFPNRISYTGGPFDFSGGGNAVLQLHLSDVLGTFNLDFALNAFEFEGLVKVISAPKVTTQDNVSAEIQSGFQIPYQTRINFTTTIQYVDATLRLSVTPQITEAGTVIMDINVQKNEPTTGLAIEGAAGTPLSTRTAHTKLMVRDGGTAVIGGIYQVKDNDSRTRLPFIYQIPILGNLFKTHNVSSSHDELLIFITPRIIRGV
ncbi:MAG TPA: type IV pilus secretin PilQ [Thermoanaerobaculia bacterium]|nr:type IV pilus secretin PilQ [Thermoanaerobaculia bacterium]